MEKTATYDAVVVGGGPAGATAAHDLAARGHRVLLLDKAGRIKPCGGAVPPRLIRDFDVPDRLIKARIRTARMVSPSDVQVDMAIENGYVGMVDRDEFDEWLRERARARGAERQRGKFERIERDADGRAHVVYSVTDGGGQDTAVERRVATRLIIGADGALSAVGRAEVPASRHVPYVFAYHEIIKSPATEAGGFDAKRCDVYYQGRVSPDFYGWVFPHGETTSVGVGSRHKGFSLRGAVKELRAATSLDGQATVRHEGAPIPMKPAKRWDNGRDVILAGDAAGVVAPASGEGIYYAMVSAEMVAQSGDIFLRTGRVQALAEARRIFMREHGRVFFVLGILQHFWYRNDKRRERFVDICRDPDVQRLTFESYMNKKLVRKDPMAHVKIFFKDLGHLLGLVPAKEKLR